MEKKVLFCATMDIHFKKFHLPYLKWFKEQGWEVHVAAFGDMTIPYVDKKYHIPIQRSPFRTKNMSAYKELKGIINKNNYQVIHCHTPMGGVLARLAGRRARKSGTKVIYTAHGFHFCKGSSLVNWLLYYPIEKVLARLTDCLITINREDYTLANQRFHAGRIEHVHGVGVDTETFMPVAENDKQELRKSSGYRPDDFLMFYAAEFNTNKNQKLLIESLALIKNELQNAKLLLAGDGPLLKECQDLAGQRGVDSLIDFLGYQDDIEMFVKISDIAVGSSIREGLPVNIMEAMASGLPVLASKNRGHSELVENGVNGFIVPSGDYRLFAARLLQLYRSKKLCKKMGPESRNRMTNYSLDRVGSELEQIYSRYMVGDVNESQGKYHRSYL